jgi:hypothetical protein
VAGAIKKLFNRFDTVRSLFCLDPAQKLPEKGTASYTFRGALCEAGRSLQV